jgi:hypothetical protein
MPSGPEFISRMVVADAPTGLANRMFLSQLNDTGGMRRT